jgi:UDP-galactopyranose mutase
LSRFTQWHNYRHQALAETSRGLVNFPVNLHTIEQLFDKDFSTKFITKLLDKFGEGNKISVSDLQNDGDEILQQGATVLYEELFKNYTMKQWGMSVDEVDPSVIARVPVYLNYNDYYFTDKYQGIPANGYTTMVKKMLDNPLITVITDTDWFTVRDKVKYERLFFSGPIDAFFDYKFGELPYRSLRFTTKELPQEYYQPTAQVNHPNHQSMTRSIEHKYILNEKSPVTVVSFEYPQAYDGTNERYYPINNSETADLYAKYLALAKNYPNIYFVGRLGDYKYYNMDQTVARALQLYDEVFKN